MSTIFFYSFNMCGKYQVIAFEIMIMWINLNMYFTFKRILKNTVKYITVYKYFAVLFH